MPDSFATIDKRHLTVKLIKITIKTVGTWIFITETWSNLVIAREASNHEKLLKLLRSLRKSVKESWLQTRRNEKVASTFRAGVGENWSSDFNKVMLVHVVSKV